MYAWAFGEINIIPLIFLGTFQDTQGYHTLWKERNTRYTKHTDIQNQTLKSLKAILKF